MPAKANLSGNPPVSYDQDYYAWAMNNAHALRAGRLFEIDAANIAEELEDMGRSEANRLESHLEILIMHLMKWRAQPKRRSNSWGATIKKQRRRVAKVLRQNPSLKSKLDEIYNEAYETAIYLATAETNLDEAVFSQLEPFGFDQASNAGQTHLNRQTINELRG